MAKSSVKIKADLPAIQKRIQDTFELVKKNKQAHTEAGFVVQERVKAEARRRKPLNDTRSFPPLSDKTIKRRNYLKKYNTTHKTYETSRSNLTITGQLIDAIVYELQQDQGLYKIILEVADNARLGYRTGPNSIERNPPSNQELAEMLAEKGFVLFDPAVIAINDNLKDRVATVFKRTLRRAIAINNKVNKVNK